MILAMMNCRFRCSHVKPETKLFSIAPFQPYMQKLVSRLHITAPALNCTIIHIKKEAAQRLSEEVKERVVDRKKLELAMARACMNSADLPAAAGLPRPTVNNAIVGKSVRPGTLGRIAKALGVDPAELLREEG